MKKNVFLLFCFINSIILLSQNPTDIAQRFGPEAGIGVGNCIAIQPDEKIILSIAGNYQAIGTKNLIRLNKDGSKDNSFNNETGFNGTVYSIALQTDGKIIVGGKFNSFNGRIQNCLIRLNADGSKDTGFNIGTGFYKLEYINFSNSAYIKSIAIQPNGQIIVSGEFSRYQDVNENNLMRLNADGSKDSSFNIGTGFDNIIKSISLQADNKIIVGGNFTKYQGTDQKYLIRLNTDGSKDASFVIGTGFNNIVHSIKLQSDGKIIVGGEFTIYNSFSQKCLIRLNLDGTRDTSFGIGTGFYVGAYPNKPAVYSIFIQPNGKIIVGGKFDSYQGSNSSLARLNPDGSKDTNFDIGTGFYLDVYDIALQKDEKIIVTGNFERYKKILQKGVIRLNSNGEKDISFKLGNGLNDAVRSIALQSDGKILAGGEFTCYQEGSQNRLIRFNPDGSKDTSFNVGSGFDEQYWSDEHQVQAIAVQSDGKIIVGGAFTDYKGVTQSGLVRLKPDGSNDTTFNINSGFERVNSYYIYPTISSIILQPNGKIIVGGSFSWYQKLSYKNLIRLNSNGSIDTSFSIGTGFNDAVKSVILQPDGKILVGGTFSSYKGVTTKCLIRLNTDGSLDTSFTVDSQIDYVRAFVLQSDGKITLVGMKLPSTDVCFRLNSDGSLDSSFNSGINLIDNAAYSIVVQTDGKVILGGYFSKRLIRLNSDGSKDTSFDVGTGFRDVTSIISQIYALALKPDGQILVGGHFNIYQGDNQSAYLISLKGTTTLSNENFTKDQNIFSLWPNPVHNILNLNTSISGILGIKIYDLQGKLIYTKEKETPSIDVSSFNNGLYLMKLQTEKGEISKKFIKQ